MKITYLKNSGFVVEHDDTVLIFDYYQGQLPAFGKDKNIYVFASHGHFDHFQKKIFQWAEQYREITYILSDDITDREEDVRIIPVAIRQEITVDKLTIKTLRSTDEGVAFLVYIGDKVIYHAGDLNWWHWEEEGPVYNELMRRNYQHEINKLKSEQIDVAFVPLDLRQGQQYYWGMDYFMKHTDTRYVFPMHMWMGFDACDRLMSEPDAKSYIDKVIKIREDGEVFELCV